jgi:cytochrome c-type biogenesis protein
MIDRGTGILPVFVGVKQAGCLFHKTVFVGVKQAGCLLHKIVFVGVNTKYGSKIGVGWGLMLDITGLNSPDPIASVLKCKQSKQQFDYPMLESLQTQLYQLEQFAKVLVSNQLTHLSLFSVGIIFIAGLLTSLTPCMLSMLPLTIGYIGGYEAKSRLQAAAQSTWFSLGLATTLAGLGIVAALAGKVYGQIGLGLPIVVSIIAILMGLNLLEALPIRFPSLNNTSWISQDLPKGVRSYLIGLSFGLVASPCSTPVLATILGWVANTQDLILGAILLISYTAGYVAPLILAGTFTASIKKILELRRWSGWINPVSGVILIGFGVVSLISRIPVGIF